MTLVDTGDATQTGGRLKRVLPYHQRRPDFCLTYGDGVADIDIGEEIAFHREHGDKATVAVVRPAGRFGSVVLTGDKVAKFIEKPEGDGGWINGGFFVLRPASASLSPATRRCGSASRWRRWRGMGELRAFAHHGYWHPMDTLRDQQYARRWNGPRGRAKWKIW